MVLESQVIYGLGYSATSINERGVAYARDEEESNKDTNQANRGEVIIHRAMGCGSPLYVISLSHQKPFY